MSTMSFDSFCENAAWPSSVGTETGIVAANAGRHWRVVAAFAPAIAIELEDFISGELAVIPEVERVCIVKQGDVMHVYTMVDAFDTDVHDKIYEREESIIDKFREFGFDFNIVSRRGRDAEAVMSDFGLKPCYTR